MASRAKSLRPIALFAGMALGVIAFGGAGCTCSKGTAPANATDDAASDGAAAEDVAVAAPTSGEAGGLSAPIAATHGDQGDVVVAGLDVPAKSIRVQRISAKDEVLADRTVLEGVAWSTESELKVLPAAGGVAITWRGLRAGKLVRQLLVLGPDLAPKGEPVEVAAASCATQDALWFTDGKHVHTRPWGAAPTQSALPKDKDASLVCGAHRVFALLDDDDGTSFVMLGPDAGTGTTKLFEDSQFGEDEPRERPEYTVGDDVGVVRLALSGAVALREVRGGLVGPLHKLKTALSRDADVVGVDASARTVAIVFTEDVGDACPADKGSSTASTRVKALRVDRTTFEESVVELSPGVCGREVGPFFTAAVGDAVKVGWVERVPTAGKARAPIAGLAHRLVAPSGPLGELAHVEQPADALVDAGCDASHCYAVALARRAGMDAMVPGVARVIRY